MIDEKDEGRALDIIEYSAKQAAENEAIKQLGFKKVTALVRDVSAKAFDKKKADTAARQKKFREKAKANGLVIAAVPANVAKALKENTPLTVSTHPRISEKELHYLKLGQLVSESTGIKRMLINFLLGK